MGEEGCGSPNSFGWWGSWCQVGRECAMGKDEGTIGTYCGRVGVDGKGRKGIGA